MPRQITDRSQEYFLTKIYANFDITLISVDWNHILMGDDADSTSGAFYNEVNSAISSCFPLVRLSKRRSKDKKWITKGLKICVKKKNILYKKQLVKHTEKNIKEYRNYKNMLNSCLKTQKTVIIWRKFRTSKME